MFEFKIFIPDTDDDDVEAVKKWIRYNVLIENIIVYPGFFIDKHPDMSVTTEGLYIIGLDSKDLDKLKEFLQDNYSEYCLIFETEEQSEPQGAVHHP